MNNLTAIHEAGHLLISILLGYDWKTATIKPTDLKDGRALGMVEFKMPQNKDHLMMIWMAGYASEYVMQIPISYGSKVEYQQCIEIADHDDPQGWADAMLLKTIDKLDLYNNELQQIANFLEWMETITPDTMNHVRETIQLPIRKNFLTNKTNQIQ